MRTSVTGTVGSSRWRRQSLVASLLVVICFAVYSRTIGFPFLIYDDNIYVTENPVVLSGLSLEAAWWAFTTGYFGNWHPLTWISLQFDATLGNGSPVAFRMTQITLHALTVAVVYLIFTRIGSSSVAFFGSCLYAFHPLHVESVTWISERKGILGTFFIAIATWLYLEHQRRRSRTTFVAFCLAYACSLMSKQMGVMLPFVLPLLHLASHEPLGLPYKASEEKASLAAGHAGFSESVKGWSARDQAFELAYIIKQAISANRWLYIASLVLAVTFTVVAFKAQDATGALQSLDSVPLLKRLEVVSGGYLAYLAKYFFPINLSFHYHNYRQELDTGSLIIKVVGTLLLTVSGAALARILPRYSAGVLWYILSIVPVIGVVAIGDHMMADRYTDWPLLLFHYFIASSTLWASWKIFGERKLAFRTFEVPFRLAPCLFVIIGLGILTGYQLDYRKNSISMLERAIEIDPRNPKAHQLMGLLAIRKGDFVNGRYHTEQAIRNMPWNAHAHNNLGLIELINGNPQSAETSFLRALKEFPSFVDAESNLGLALLRQERVDEAISVLERLVANEPFDVAVNLNLASAYREKGYDAKAMQQYAITIQLDPSRAQAWYGYGVVAERKELLDQAANAYVQAWALSGKTMTEAAIAIERMRKTKMSAPVKASGALQETVVDRNETPIP